MKKIGAISIFIFLTGLFAGLFFSTALSPENSSYLSSLLLYGISSPSSGFAEHFRASAVSNFTLVLLMIPALFTRFLCPLPILVLCFKSFALGFCSGLVHMGATDQAFLISLLKLFPQNIFFVPAFILLASAVCYCSAAEVMKKNRLSREKKSLKHLLFFSMLLIMAGCVTEACCRLITL